MSFAVGMIYLVQAVGAVGSESLGTVQEQYLLAWQQLLASADGVDDGAWSRPSPCAGWSVGHLIGHVIDAAHQTRSMIVGDPSVVPVSDVDALRALAGRDPARRLREAVVPLVGLVAGMDAQTVVGTPHGGLPAEQFLAMALVEAVVHGWDLAVATGQEVHLDDDAVATLLAGAQQMGGQLTATGMYAPAVVVPATADPQQRLLGLLGRHG